MLGVGSLVRGRRGGKFAGGNSGNFPASTTVRFQNSASIIGHNSFPPTATTYEIMNQAQYTKLTPVLLEQVESELCRLTPSIKYFDYVRRCARYFRRKIGKPQYRKNTLARKSHYLNYQQPRLIIGSKRPFLISILQPSSQVKILGIDDRGSTCFIVSFS